MSLTVEKCIEAWTNSLKQMRVKADIVFFGDSLTYYGDFAPLFPDKIVCNLGLRGDTIQGMIRRVEQVMVLKPQVIYLMAGINDVARLSVNEFEEQYKQLIYALHDVPVIVQNILPVNNLEFNISCNNFQISNCNSRIATISKERGLLYLDLFSIYEVNGQMPPAMTRDGIHLTHLAYSKWYNALH